VSTTYLGDRLSKYLSLSSPESEQAWALWMKCWLPSVLNLDYRRCRRHPGIQCPCLLPHVQTSIAMSRLTPACLELFFLPPVAPRTLNPGYFSLLPWVIELYFCGQERWVSRARQKKEARAISGGLSSLWFWADIDDMLRLFPIKWASSLLIKYGRCTRLLRHCAMRRDPLRLAMITEARTSDEQRFGSRFSDQWDRPAMLCCAALWIM